ncbi:MAG: hypothetical protein ISS19_03010 [Bacteroidales bacterium]|nr:hypothetical protein [Bacteroidales bacterium]
MREYNKLDNLFGPVGRFAGLFLLAAGIVITLYSLSGLIIMVSGALFAFTSSGTIIDYDKKKIKFSTNLFGIIPTGKWMEIEPVMKIGIKESRKVWRTYSRSNRTLDIPDHDFRLILYDSADKPLIPVRKTGTLDAAKTEQQKISNQLGIGLI